MIREKKKKKRCPETANQFSLSGTFVTSTYTLSRYWSFGLTQPQRARKFNPILSQDAQTFLMSNIPVQHTILTCEHSKVEQSPQVQRKLSQGYIHVNHIRPHLYFYFPDIQPWRSQRQPT